VQRDSGKHNRFERKRGAVSGDGDDEWECIRSSAWNCDAEISDQEHMGGFVDLRVVLVKHLVAETETRAANNRAISFCNLAPGNSGGKRSGMRRQQRGARSGEDCDAGWKDDADGDREVRFADSPKHSVDIDSAIVRDVLQAQKLRFFARQRSRCS
jgi:hypothetical protein